MAASQLGLYNDALISHLGERALVSLSERREVRYSLDWAYPLILDECLESGYWKHAKRTMQITASTSITPEFGPTYAFDVPPDCLDFYMLRTSPEGPPFNDYTFEAGLIRANVDTLYITYVSNDPSFGLTMSRWAPSFTAYVGAALAARIAMAITKSEKKADYLNKVALRLRREALSLDARRGGTQKLPMGSWANSRLGGWPIGDRSTPFSGG